MATTTKTRKNRASKAKAKAEDQAPKWGYQSNERQANQGNLKQVRRVLVRGDFKAVDLTATVYNEDSITVTPVSKTGKAMKAVTIPKGQYSAKLRFW